jgi:hypothetical protein
MVDDALLGYVSYKSPHLSDGTTDLYVGTATDLRGAALSWRIVQSEVDAGRPMAFTVDMNADGQTDHMVAVIGYAEIGGARLYAFYSTWDDTVWWANFDMMHKGNYYGVFGGVLFSISLAGV